MPRKFMIAIGEYVVLTNAYLMFGGLCYRMPEFLQTRSGRRNVMTDSAHGLCNSHNAH